MKEPEGELQVATMGVIKDHAKTVQGIHEALLHDYRGRWSFNDVLCCVHFLEKHKRVASAKRGGEYYFEKVDGATRSV